jgi:hypothetical protein
VGAIELWDCSGRPLLKPSSNARADAKDNGATMSRTFEGYTDVGKYVVHLYTQCPVGCHVGYRVPLRSYAPSARNLLIGCEWCREKEDSAV